MLDDRDPQEARWARIDHMLSGSGVDRTTLRAHPRGVDLGRPIEHGRFFDSTIQTSDGRVDCCPPAFADALVRCAAIFDEHAASTDRLQLVNRRDSRMHNSWYANVAGMKRGDRTENRLAIQPDDARRLGLADRQRASVRSEWGSIEVPIEYDDRLRPGVVSLEHGWGPQPGLTLARTAPGANVNALIPHGPGSFDRLSNQQHLTGVPVTIAPAS